MEDSVFGTEQPDPLTEDIAEQIELLSDQAPKSTGVAEERHSGGSNPNEKVRMFSFHDLDTAIRLAHSLKDFFHSENTIYKHTDGETFYLILKQGSHPAAEFNRISHMVSEYLVPERYTPGREAYLKEHLRVLIPHQALQSLAEIEV